MYKYTLIHHIRYVRCAVPFCFSALIHLSRINKCNGNFSFLLNSLHQWLVSVHIAQLCYLDLCFPGCDDQALTEQIIAPGKHATQTVRGKNDRNELSGQGSELWPWTWSSTKIHGRGTSCGFGGGKVFCSHLNLSLALSVLHAALQPLLVHPRGRPPWTRPFHKVRRRSCWGEWLDVCTVCVTSGPTRLRPRGQQQDTLIPAGHGLGSAADAQGRDHSLQGSGQSCSGYVSESTGKSKLVQIPLLIQREGPKPAGWQGKGFLKAI